MLQGRRALTLPLVAFVRSGTIARNLRGFANRASKATGRGEPAIPLPIWLSGDEAGGVVLLPNPLRQGLVALVQSSSLMEYVEREINLCVRRMLALVDCTGIIRILGYNSYILFFKTFLFIFYFFIYY